MAVSIQFVHFPKSDVLKKAVSSRIVECVEKFSDDQSVVKTFFSREGDEHHVKIHLHVGHVETVVNAEAEELGQAVDKAIKKLESSLRKTMTKRRAIKSRLPQEDSKSKFNAVNQRSLKRNAVTVDNVFDKFEDQYADDFDEKSPKTPKTSKLRTVK